MPSQTRDDKTVIRDKLTQAPALAPFLNRIADRCDRNGTLAGRMKLGERLEPRGALGDLRRVFGKAIRVSRNGTATLDFDAFFAQLGGTPDRRQEWIRALYAGLERKPLNRRAHRRKQESCIEQLIGRWKLAFPDLADLEEWLRTRKTILAKRLADHGEKALTDWCFAIADAVRILAQEGQAISPADLGARAFGDSKALRNSETRRMTGEALADLLGQQDENAPLNAETALRMGGLVDNPTALKVTLYGPLRYKKHGTWFNWIADLYTIGESATLSWDNLAGIEDIDPGIDTGFCLTCENETPFCNLIPEHLPCPVVYTEGYPNAAVRKLLDAMPPRIRIHHWGDSDLDGLRIASILNRIRPVTLFRCSLPELRRHTGRLLPLSPHNRHRAQDWLENHPDFPFADELRFTLQNGWLEQESWTAE
jgi:hypothetical protein